MATGVKTGGRQKGSLNKATLARAAAAAGAGPDTASDLLPDIKKGGGPALPRYRRVRTDSLIPYANNARTHSPAQVGKIAASMREFGFTNPVLVDGKLSIIAGHGRVLAAQSLAMETVPVIELLHLNAAQKRALRLADNRLALDAGWDDELLALELGALRDLGFDLGPIGFDAGELDALFGDDDEAGAGSGAGSLAAQFGVCPFTVLNAREGWWQDRKRAWLALGIQSELGRGDTEAHPPHTGKGMADGLVALRAEQKAGRKANAIAGGVNNATPGGSKMPAADYSKRQRGDGRGRAVA